MTDRPILFSGPMVRALLDGRKTQTRRVVKGVAGADAIEPHEEFPGEFAVWMNGEQQHSLVCPYGCPGDRLWVKETWRAQEAFDHMSPTEIGQAFADEYGEPWCPIRYVADGKCEGSVEQWQESPLGKTRVSIHMPRWASRLTLEITEVRVERLQDISEADALAEGIIEYEADQDEDGDPAEYAWDEERGRGEVFPRASAAYADLWDHINGPGAWDANPWVWAVSFEVAR